MRTKLMILASLVATVLFAGAAVAVDRVVSGMGSGPVNRMAFEWRVGSPVTTTSTDWTPLVITVPPHGPGQYSPAFTATTRGGMAVTLSVDVHGAGAQFRILDGDRAFRPGRASFKARAGDTSRSFTFVTRGSQNATCHQIVVQWRSPSGQLASVTRAAARWDYRHVSASAC